MSGRKLKACIIGCGKIFPMHAVSVSSLDDAVLLAVCDNKPERAKAASERFHCGMYTDYREMIDKEKPDVVHVCTPHYLHPEMAIYALESGCDVVSEKPIAITLEDALREERVAKECGRQLLISFQNRFNPGSVLIKDAIDSGKVGKVKSARAIVTWSRSDEYYSHSDWKGTWDKEGGGVIIDQAIHTLDLMNWFLGGKIQSVKATIDNRCHDIIKVDDVAEGLITYRNGATASFYANNYYGYDAPVEIELVSDLAILRLVGERATISWFDGHEEIADRDPREKFEFGDVKQYWGVGHMREIRYFYDCILHGKQTRNSVSDVMETQRLVCAIYESGKSGKVVSLPE